MRRTLRHWVIGLCALAALASAAFAGPAGEKSRVAVRDLNATPSVLAQSEQEGTRNTLDQITQGYDSQVITALSQTRKFDVVARSDLRTVLKEQDLQESGLTDSLDPQAAKSLSLAGCRYLATLTVDNFQDIAKQAALEGQFGRYTAEKRTIQIQAVLKLYDTTTGVLLEASSMSFSRSADDKIDAGETEVGRKTNRLIGEIAAEMARSTANRIADVVYPAKVMAMTGGVITFNRTAESGVSMGQIWEIMHAGETLVDPDTGEVLGAEEISIGWAEVIDAGTKFSRARTIQDLGVERGAILRLRPSGLPAGVVRTSTNGGTGSSVPSGARRPGLVPPPARTEATESEGVAPIGPQPRPPAPGNTAPTQPVALNAAIFVKNRAARSAPTETAPGMDDAKVMVLEDYVFDTVTAAGLRVIAREDVVNAVSAFATEGANAGQGTSDSTHLERILSDSTSARALATNMGANLLVIASITSLTREVRTFRDPDLDVAADVAIWNLDVTYRILDGATGLSQDTGTVSSSTKLRQGGNLRVSSDPRDALLRDAAGKIGEKAAAAVATRKIAPSEPAAETGVQIHVAMADLSVPEVRIDPASGEYVITANRYQLEAMAVTVSIDGLLVGSAPGTFQIAPGIHRVRLERALFEPFEQIVNVREGMVLTVPMVLSEDGRRRWMESSSFLESLKDRAALRDENLEKAHALAEFMRASSIHVHTGNAEGPQGAAPALWPRGE